MDSRMAVSCPFHLLEIASSASKTRLVEARDLMLEYGRFVIALPGAARFCFGSLEAEAARRKAVFLDTIPASMGTAHRMHLGLGFEPCAQYNDNPVEGLAYLRRNL